MSSRRKPRKDGSPRKIARTAKLLGLPEKERRLVAGWVDSDGWQRALQRIATELHIECKKTALYEALAFWSAEERHERAKSKALAQIQLEAAEKNWSPQERMAALDRAMAEIKAVEEDHDGYNNARYVMLAAETARAKAELEAAKLKLKERQLAQKDRDIELADRRVRLLEENAAKAKATLETVKKSGGLSKEALRQIEEAAAML